MEEFASVDGEEGDFEGDIDRGGGEVGGPDFSIGGAVD